MKDNGEKITTAADNGYYVNPGPLQKKARSHSCGTGLKGKKRVGPCEEPFIEANGRGGLGSRRRRCGCRWGLSEGRYRRRLRLAERSYRR